MTAPVRSGTPATSAAQASQPAARPGAGAPTPPPTVVLDVAGGATGGAARWRAELDGYLASPSRPVRIIGRGEQITPGWLIRRERLARGAGLVVAPNNISFVLSGTQRRVLVRNALHFLYPWEEHLLAGMPRGWRAQIPIVRAALRRADTVVVPCSAMAERVLRHVGGVRDRLVVRAHPVTPAGPRELAAEPFLLVPVLLSPYKNLIAQVRLLARAVAALETPLQLRVTTRPADLPPDLAADARIVAIGPQPHERLAELWRSASAVFFPSTVESFGYPLAEARVYGVPVIAVASEQAREIAGAALRGYDPAVESSLAEAVARIGDPLVADPRPFDRDSYFQWLFDGEGD